MAGMGGRLRRGRGNDRRGALPEAGATSVTVARGKVETLGTLVESAVLFLVTLSLADKTGIMELGVIREKDRISLVEKGLSSVCSFLGLLGMQVGDSFFIGSWNGG